MLRATSRCVLATFLIAASPAVVRAAGEATVRGADVVNVREGPSTDTPAFISLEKGRVVTVEKVIGDWAQVRLESGRQGYVRSLYLALPPGIEVLAAEAGTAGPEGRATEAPTPPQAPAPRAAAGAPSEPLPPGAAHTPAAARQPAGEGLEGDVAELRKRLAALESAVVATPGAAGAQGTPHGHGMTGGAHETNRPYLVPTVADLPNAQDLGPSLAMAGVGVVLGFLIGAAYGRRQERNRRSRVRF